MVLLTMNNNNEMSKDLTTTNIYDCLKVTKTSHQNALPSASSIKEDVLCILPQLDENRNEKDFFIFRGQNINQYSVIAMLGKGSFGQVFKCHDHLHNIPVAMKILNPKKSLAPAKNEIQMLKYLSDKDKDNLFVKYCSDFVWHGFHCVVLELLGENLYDHLKRKSFSGLPLQDVHFITRQLVCALVHLHTLNIIHCDIKPENIALVPNCQNAKIIKLIDFGSSCFNGSAVFRYIQSRFYRAIEVVLEIGYDFMIDTWSVGCVLVELLIGSPLFPGGNEMEQMGYFIQTFGNIPDHLIKSSPKFLTFYKTDQYNYEFKMVHKFKPYSKTLINIIVNCPSARAYIDTATGSVPDFSPLSAFIDLISKMLIFDARYRIKPKEGLHNHPFLKYDWIELQAPSVLPTYSYDVISPCLKCLPPPPPVHYQASFAPLAVNQILPPIHYLPTNNVRQTNIQQPSQFITPAMNAPPPPLMGTGHPNYIVNYAVPYPVTLIPPHFNMYSNVLMQWDTPNHIVPFQVHHNRHQTNLHFITTTEYNQ